MNKVLAAAVFTIAKMGKSNVLHNEEAINYTLNIHMMGYYAAIKKNKATIIQQTDMEQSLRYYKWKKIKSKIEQ